jgi:hypothetical protein
VGRFRREAGGDRIDIEFDPNPTGDVDPAPAPARPSASWRPSTAVWAVATVAVVVLVGALAAVLGPTDDRSIEPVPTTATVPVLPTRAPATTPPVTRVTTTAAPAQRPFGVDTGIVLYLTPNGGAPDSMLAYDVDAAEMHSIDLGRDIGWYVRAVEAGGGVVVDGGRVVLVTDGLVSVLDEGGNTGYEDAPSGRVASLGDGSMWLRRSDPYVLDLVATTGATTSTRLDLPRGADLYGTMADGRPVVRGADGRSFAVGLDGQRTLLAQHVLAPVEAGQFAETRCDEEQHCEVIGHVGGAEVSLGPPVDENGTERLFRFQPNGTSVAVAVGTQLSILDARTGASTTVLHDLRPDSFVGDSTSMQFLPNGMGLAASTERGVVLVDLTGREVAVVPAGEVMPGPLLLGVGVTRPWASS